MGMGMCTMIAALVPYELAALADDEMAKTLRETSFQQ